MNRLNSAVLFAGALFVVALSFAGLARPAFAAPQYGTWGYDLSARDTVTRAGDDFFEFANGGWLGRTEIPADRAGTSLRLLMSNRTEERIHDLLEQDAAQAPHEPTTLDGKVGAFYKAFLDSARAEQLGATPLAPLLEAVRAAKTRDDLAALAGRSNYDLEGTLFNVVTDVDVKDPTRYAVFVSQAGLGLPDRDYYSQPSFAEKKAKYEAYVAQLLDLEGWPDAAARAKDVLALETAVAAASWAKEQQRDPNATYNPDVDRRAHEVRARVRVAAVPCGRARGQARSRDRVREERVPEAGRDLVADAAADPARLARLHHRRQRSCVSVERLRERVVRDAREDALRAAGAERALEARRARRRRR